MRSTAAFFMAVSLCAAAFAQPIAPGGQQAAAAEPNRQIGVYITGAASEEAKKALSREILYSLVSGGQYVPPSRPNDFEAALAAEAQANQRVNDVRLIEIAGQSGLGYVCAADIMTVFGTHQILTRIVSVQTGALESIGKDYNEIKSTSDFSGIANKVTGSMFGMDQVPQAVAAREAGEHVAAASACAEARDYDCAIAEYDKALAIDPALLPALLGRADAYQRKGDYQRAVDDYSRSIEIDPNEAGIYNSRAFAYEQLGNFGMAVADYSRSLEIEPNDAGIYTSRAAAYRQMGNEEKAVGDYQAALSIDPNNAAAKEALELIQLDKDGGEEKRSYDGRIKSRVRFGVTGAFTIPMLTQESNSGLGNVSGNGFGYSFGLALSVPLVSWFSAEMEANYDYRYIELDGRPKRELEEQAVSFPVMFRVSVLGARFMGFAEGGARTGFPLGTNLRHAGADSDPVKIVDRYEVEAHGVIGVGVGFKAGAMFYLSVRYAFPMTDFAEGIGGPTLRLHQPEFRVSVMF